MKKKKQITLANVLSFLEGQSNYFLNFLNLYPKHKQEQAIWRIEQCKDDCVKEGACVYCGCPPHKKVFVNKSCNNGDRFPDMMDEEAWEQFKINNNIEL